MLFSCALRGCPSLPAQLSGLVQGNLYPEEGHLFLVCTKMPLVPQTLCPWAMSAWRGAFPISHRLCAGSGGPCMPISLPTWLGTAQNRDHVYFSSYFQLLTQGPAHS